MTDDILDLADALSDKNDPPLKTFLLGMLREADNRHEEAENCGNEHDVAYWQGKKDAVRLVLAEYLNQPEIAYNNVWYQWKRRACGH